MKSKDLQNIVISKRQNGDGPTEIFRDLSGRLCLKTVKRWCKMRDQTGTVSSSRSPGCPRIIRMSATIDKMKNRLKGGGTETFEGAETLPYKYSKNTENDLRYFSYKIIIKLMLIKLRENGSQIGFDRTSVKRFSFRTRNFLTLMVRTTLKMIAFGLLVVSW